MSEPYDFDRELDEVERFIAAVQAGDVGTSAAMAAYRDRHRPAIARLRAELEAFRALLAEDEVAPAGDEVAPAGDEVAPAGDEVAPAGDDAVPADDVLDGQPIRHPGGRDDPEDEG